MQTREQPREQPLLHRHRRRRVARIVGAVVSERVVRVELVPDARGARGGTVSRVLLRVVHEIHVLGAAVVVHLELVCPPGSSKVPRRSLLAERRDVRALHIAELVVAELLAALVQPPLLVRAARFDGAVAQRAHAVPVVPEWAWPLERELDVAEVRAVQQREEERRDELLVELLHSLDRARAEPRDAPILAEVALAKDRVHCEARG